MLHMINECISGRASKTTFFQVSVLHIDESSALGLSHEERQEKNKAVKAIVDNYGYKAFFVPLEEVFGVESLFHSSVQDQLKSITTNDGEDKLRKLCSSSVTNTAKEDLLAYLRTTLLAYYAKREGFDKVLLGSSASRLAVQLISLTCKGRGFSLPDELAAIETKFNDVSFLRPMRDFLGKEIAIYNRYKKIEPLIVPSLDTMAPLKFSIDHLSENFIENLQSEYNHTVHTLLRSAGKLTKLASGTEQYYCPLCLSCLAPSELTAETSSACYTTEKCNDCTGNCGNLTVDTKRLVCYGCKRVVQELDINLLPDYVTDNSKKLVINKNLRDEIKEFLLEE